MKSAIFLFFSGEYVKSYERIIRVISILIKYIYRDMPDHVTQSTIEIITAALQIKQNYFIGKGKKWFSYLVYIATWYRLTSISLWYPTALPTIFV